MYVYKDIKQVHLEVTQRCQAACPMCDRNENGGVDNRWIDNSELSLDECKRIFTTDFIQQFASFAPAFVFMLNHILGLCCLK